MLPDFLVDWWFSPWTYVPVAPIQLLEGAYVLAQRDGYRMWCEQGGISTALPAQFDPEWHVAVVDGASLVAAARLYAGLFAARAQDQRVLAALRFEDRKWCMSIAATQPLTACRQLSYGTDDALEVRGLVELGRRLECEFPGMWARLRLSLPEQLGKSTEVLVQEAVALNEERGKSSVRAQRCWLLCRIRAQAALLEGASQSEQGVEAITA
jgi:hypothetical protein